MRIAVGALALGSALFWAGAALADEQPDLSDLSIEQLAQLKVTSVSKQAQPLNEAPASLYVIDHDQIVRSGAVTIPEILRLAPNLQVYQESPAHWVVTARGLDGMPAAQSYSNKLLVLVDGRTVYTPLFSGVYWDLPDLLPDDIERIEVISGPGATLWGANAVNGVINIITRTAGSTSGFFVDARGGSTEKVLGARLSGTTGDKLSYRAYVRWLDEDAFDLPGGGSADDGWHRLGAGFRVDWTPARADAVILQGDIFGGREQQPLSTYEDIAGRDLVLRWNREMDDGQQFQLQTFYDYVSRATGPDGGSFFVDTYDLDLQDSLAIGSRNKLVWGGGARLAHYDIHGTPNLYFLPASRNLFLANAFVQDTLALSNLVSVTAGLKAEHDPYVGTSLLPDVRIALTPSDKTLLWAAVSHAVRSPTPFDEDVQEHTPGDIVELTGNRDFRTEKLTAYEVGVRAQPLSGLSLSATGFYHQYDDLRTIELGTGPAFLNLYWGNGLAGHSYGVEAWASASPLPWWTLTAGATLMREDFHFRPGASGIVGTSQNGVDPAHRFTLQSSMDLGRSVMFDLFVRDVGRLGDGRLADGGVPAYAELGGRLAWNASDHLQLNLTGSNLLHANHVEYPGGDAIPRAVLVGLQWRP